MKATRILASFLVMGTAIMLSYFILTKLTPNINPAKPEEILNVKEKPSFQPLLSGLNLPKPSKIASDSPEEIGNNPIDTQTNLTTLLAKKGFESIIKDYKGTKIASPDPKKLAELSILFDNETAKLEGNFNFGPLIDGSELNISKDSSATITKKYLNGISLITDTFFVNYDFEEVITDLKNLKVPQNLVSFHQELISLLITERNLFLAIKNYDSDPIKASLATKQLPAVLEKAEITTKFLNELSERYQ